MKALILVSTLACGTLFAQDVREYSGPVSFHEDQEGVTALVDGVRVAVRSKGFSQRALSFWEAAPVRGSLTFVDAVPSALDVSALEAVLTKEISVLVAGTIRLISPGTRVLIVAQKQWGVLELQPLDCGLPADVRAHASKASLRLAATHAGKPLSCAPAKLATTTPGSDRRLLLAARLLATEEGTPEVDRAVVRTALASTLPTPYLVALVEAKVTLKVRQAMPAERFSSPHHACLKVARFVPKSRVLQVVTTSVAGKRSVDLNGLLHGVGAALDYVVGTSSTGYPLHEGDTFRSRPPLRLWELPPHSRSYGGAFAHSFATHLLNPSATPEPLKPYWAAQPILRLLSPKDAAGLVQGVSSD